MSWTRCSCAENNRMAPSTTRIAFASFIGTAIEFYDFYIYGLAVAMVIGPVFFPSGDPAAQALTAFLGQRCKFGAALNTKCHKRFIRSRDDLHRDHTTCKGLVGIFYPRRPPTVEFHRQIPV